MKGLTFILTDKCNITCDFCAPNCGPKIKGALSAETMIRVYDEMSSLMPVANVVFTGGEPTLYINDVVKVIQHIKKDGVSSRIVTNAYWGKTEKLARRFLTKLKNAGLYEFNFSVDDFHQKYISYEAIKRATELALEYEFPVLLAHKTYPDSESDISTFEALLDRTIPIYEDLTPDEKDKHKLCFSSGNTIPVGRGIDTIDVNKWVPSNLPRSYWEGPCDEVLRNITVQSDGSVSPCCGLVDRGLGVFYYGSVYEKSIPQLISKANSSTLYNWLALEGPEGLMNAILEKSTNEKFHGTYLQNCQLCQEIFSSEQKMKILIDCIPEKVNDLSAKRMNHEVHRSLYKSKTKPNIYMTATCQ